MPPGELSTALCQILNRLYHVVSDCLVLRKVLRDTSVCDTSIFFARATPQSGERQAGRQVTHLPPVFHTPAQHGDVRCKTARSRRHIASSYYVIGGSDMPLIVGIGDEVLASALVLSAPVLLFGCAPTTRCVHVLSMASLFSCRQNATSF